MKSIQSAIIKTLCYADVFDYPLKQQEIFHHLIWEHSQTPPTRKDLIPVLFDLTKGNTISQTNGHFHLQNRDAIVTIRKKRMLISLKKLSLAKKIIHQFKPNPYILGVFLTGALSMKNSDESDDIDVLIITKTNKLWTTRLRLTTELQFKGLRRTRFTRPGRVNNLLCTNMYLDETALMVPIQKQNLYTAHEVAQVKPLYNKDQVHQRFLLANKWIQNYLPNISIPKNTLCHSGLDPESMPTKLSLSESLIYKLQHTYMKPTITRELITPHMAYFHPRNTSHHVISKYNNKIKKYLTHKS